MEREQEKALARLSHRVTLRLCEELTMVDLGADPHMTATMMAAMKEATDWGREEIDTLDMHIDALLHKQVKNDPLALSAIAMQRAAQDIHVHLYHEGNLYIPAKTIFDLLKGEIAQMRQETGVSLDARTP